MNVIQIEATNSCNNNCANCTRFCGHYTSDKIFWATLEDIEAALVSLKDYQHVVGLIGGEPTLHPLFEEITMLYKKYRPRIQCGLWSNGSTKQYRQYKSLIDEVYYIRNINDHKSNVIHTPMLVSADSLSKSNEEKKSFFDNCWVQMTWSATVTPRGGYFCEVAGMLSWLFDGPEGRKIRDNPEWWKAPIETFKDQAEWACHKCGGAFPCYPKLSKLEIDDLSEDNLERLRLVNSPKINSGKYEIYNKGLKFGQNRKCDWYWGGD
jgi:hypothetical protein